MSNLIKICSRASLCCLCLICHVTFTTSRSSGQDTIAIGYRTPYAIAKPVISSRFTSDSSLDLRRRAVLIAAEVGYGRRAPGALGNSVNVLAKTPGGQGLALRMAVDNPAVRKGALRAARVAGAVDADTRFQVVALDQPVRDRAGRLITDRDILYRHRRSGALGRLEVKDVNVSSQRTKLEIYKRQIREMGLEQRKTAQQQAFVNRRGVISELRDYARQHRVSVYENVVTSNRNAARQGTTAIADVLDAIDDNARVSFRLRVTGAGLGVVMFAFEAPRVIDAWRSYSDGNRSLSEAGFRTLTAGAGGSFAVSGVASTLATQINASNRAAVILGRAGQVAGPAGTAMAAGALGLRGYQWYSGELSARRFTVEATSAAGGFAGAWAGAGVGGWGGVKIGGAIGAFAGPEAIPVGAAVGGFLGTIGGAIGGAWAGQTIAETGVSSIYSRLDRKQQDLLLVDLIRIYEAKTR